MSTAKRELIIQEADRLAARGKLDAAIKEYKRAVDLAPHDTNALNRLGDLLVRVSRIPEAIEVYQRIADHFGQDGFFLKAIAIYKKVNRLDPRRTETYERLADLYFKQGLVVEGRQQLVTLADWFLRSKQPQEAVRVYRRLVELEPTNFQARAKLVDLSVQLGDAAAVGQEIDALGRSLIARGMLDEAIKLYHRALDLNPEQGDFVAPCLDALVAGGRTSQAAELARKALATTKGGIELKRAAAGACLAAGDVQAARRLLEDVLPASGGRADVAQLYGEVMAQAGEDVGATELLLPTIDRLVEAGDLDRAVTLVERLLPKHAGESAVLERALRVFDRRSDHDMVASIEAALAEAYYREGRNDDAAEVYRRVAAESPDNPLVAERLAELGVAVLPPEVPPEAAPEATAPTRPVDEAVEFVDMAIPTPAPTPVPSAGPAPAAPVGVNIEELFTEAQVFAKYGLTDKASAHLERLLAVDPAHARARALLESLVPAAPGVELGRAVAGKAPSPAAEVGPPVEDEWPPEVEVRPPAEDEWPPELEVQPPAPPQPEGEPAPAEEVAFSDLGSPVADAGPPPGLAAAEPAAVPQVDLTPPVPELSLGEVAPAPPTGIGEALPVFEAVAAAVAEVVEAPRAAEARRAPTGPIRLENLEAMLGLRPRKRGAATPPRPVAPPPPEPEIPVAFPAPRSATPPAIEAPRPEPAPEPVMAAVVEEPLELVELPGVLAGPGEEQLRELDFLIQQGLLDDAGKLLGKLRESFADHPDLATRHALLKARGWDGERREPVEPASAAALFTEEEQFFDLAAELEKELAEEEMVAEATGAGKASDVSIEELFKEFQRGVAEQVQEEDYDTHFNLGLAYREMGLLDEAIGEFQLSAKSPDFLVESASMIGACFLDKGLPEQGVEWYARALTAPGLPVEMELGLRYELGKAQETAGNTAAALASFTRVLAINPAFRDVVDRVAKLRSN